MTRQVRHIRNSCRGKVFAAGSEFHARVPKKEKEYTFVVEEPSRINPKGPKFGRYTAYIDVRIEGIEANNSKEAYDIADVLMEEMQDDLFYSKSTAQNRMSLTYKLKRGTYSVETIKVKKGVEKNVEPIETY